MEAAQKNLEECATALKRISDVSKLVEQDSVFKAFKYANEAMNMQRKRISNSDMKWYPFQIAFILQEMESIVNKQSQYRETVDLLWFPTGGGKTEAYLGIAAFVIFYRRIEELKKGRNDVGVAIIMRYTLRLLSFQQFERAAAMICACEIIRKRDNLGDTAFGIGLWAGGAMTPNKLDAAKKYLESDNRQGEVSPMLLKKCPWCGAELSESNYHVDIPNARMHIRCDEDGCYFNGGLPIHLIDEDIYAHKPSFIIGTLDKFAQLAFNTQAGAILGVDSDNPPELFIQDELHLISGPLGTMAGLYEAAILKIAEKQGIKPKVIASTATIKNSKNQIMALYGMDCKQFPPQGLDIDDSFFAKVSTMDERPARCYMGVMSSGSATLTTFTKIMASLLFASRYLIDLGYSNEVIDSFWTETGYFNTLRELGAAKTRISDSVQDRFEYLVKTKLCLMKRL